MRTIVVPTDFSACASNAAFYGAELAANINASLTLLHICEAPIVYPDFPALSPTELTQEAEKILKQLKKKLTRKISKPINIFIATRTGTINTQLKEFCQKVKPYAVVMGNYGQKEVQSFLLGSNAVWAMNHLQWPLIIVPAIAKFKSIKAVGLAFDIKKTINTSPLEEVRNMIEDFGADLHILYINTGESKDQYDAALVQGSGKLHEILHDLHPHYHFIDYPNIEEAIQKYSKKFHLNLLIVVPRKHDLLHRLFHQSHTKQLALHTKVPVMSIHE